MFSAFRRYDQYSSLDPLQALRLFTDFAEKQPEYVRLLADMALQAAETPFGTRLDIAIPRRRGRWQEEARAAWQALFDADPQTARSVPNVRLNWAGSLSVAEAVPNLLRAESPPAEPLEHGYLPQEKLLVARDPGVERGRAIYEALRLHATQSRMALVQSRAGAIYVYHVLDDEARQSSFQGALAGDLFADSTLLQTYASNIRQGEEPYRVFLPASVQPTREVLDLLVRLTLAAPTAFGLSADRPPRTLLLAITDEDPRQLLLLGQARFYHAWEMGRSLSFERYEAPRVQDAKRQLAGLRGRIRDAAPDAGYRVRLRAAQVPRTGNDAALQREYNEVKRAMSQLRERLAELNALRAAHPRLLRFRAEHLPLLVRVLQRYRPADLANLRYSYTATDRDPAGVHWLYVQPSATPQGLDPTLLQELDRTDPLTYWLDPTWAAHYNRPQNQIMLFVPQDMRLYPAMHGWKVTQMDQILRSFIPESDAFRRPLLIIAPADDPQNLAVTVLDFDGLAPLTSPDVMRFLNDHLTVLRHLKNSEQEISAIATAQRRREQYEAALDSLKSVKQQYEAKAQVVETDYARFIDGLLQTLDEEYSAIIDEARTFIEHARKLEGRLAQLVEVHDRIEGRVTETEKLLDDASAAARKLGNSAQAAEKRILQALQAADTTRQKLDGEINKTVDYLHKRRAELENKIAELERLL